MNAIKKRVFAITIALALATTAGAAESKKMLAEAKVDRTHAEVIALGRAPGGKIKSSEIEREHGRLVWSFDIAMPKSANLTEVQVDAKTGKVVSVKQETAKEEKEEAKEEKAKKH